VINNRITAHTAAANIDKDIAKVYNIYTVRRGRVFFASGPAGESMLGKRAAAVVVLTVFLFVAYVAACSACFAVGKETVGLAIAAGGIGVACIISVIYYVRQRAASRRLSVKEKETAAASDAFLDRDKPEGGLPRTCDDVMKSEDALIALFEREGADALRKAYAAEAELIWNEYTGEAYDENTRKIDALVNRYRALFEAERCAAADGAPAEAPTGENSQSVPVPPKQSRQEHRPSSYKPIRNRGDHEIR